MAGHGGVWRSEVQRLKLYYSLKSQESQIGYDTYITHYQTYYLFGLWFSESSLERRLLTPNGLWFILTSGLNPMKWILTDEKSGLRRDRTRERVVFGSHNPLMMV